MKKTLIAMAILVSGSAFAGGQASGVAQQEQLQNQTTAVQSGSQSTANNAGNNQSLGANQTFNPTINFNSPDVSTSNINQNQTVNANTTSTNTTNVHQTGDTTQRVITEGGTTNRVISEGGTKNEIVYSGTQTIKNVPNVNGPPLTTSNDTCMGSWSAGVGVAGFGVSGGSTVIDANCVMLKNSREFWNMGLKGAAIARMCMDAKNREALELTDFACPQTERENAIKQKAEADALSLQASNKLYQRDAGKAAGQVLNGFQNVDLSDPYIRARATK